MARRSLFDIPLLSVILPTIAILAAVVTATSCRNIPGDSGWPSPATWASFNETIGGRLIATIPQASVCHTSPFSNYNAEACQALKAGWNLAGTFATHPAEIVNAFYQNQSCDPFTPAVRPCELGNYAVYSVNATDVHDVKAGIEFARKNNLRLVIKTTGHDYTGKSSGHGALSIWMWNLKSSTVIHQYESPSYSGPAIKLGAGVTGGDGVAAARKAGYRLVTGECPSIAVAGGYTQGGGHSMLNTAYGMAADQVLEWEVVTAAGEHLIATPEQNADLYWALSGGSPGSFGVVLSMTAKIHPDGPVAGGSLSFPNTNPASFWEAVSLWIQQAHLLVGQNNTIIYLILNDAFEAMALTLPDQPESAVQSLLSPFLTHLDRLGIPYSLQTTHFETYHDHFHAYFGTLPENPTTILNNRIIPRSVSESPNATAQLVDAFRGTVAHGRFILGCAIMDVSRTPHPPNAVLPAWRDTATSCNVNGFWNYTAPIEINHALKKELVEVHLPKIEAATPGGGVYANEMDPWYQGDWKHSLYGANYERLLRIKSQYDPDNLLWGNFSVNSDESFIDGRGRLCHR
ncbi:6-hydroxy-D-nicotine oxidase [Madurella mycetomatis]|uniref:6-hydroxy-D-nicotine oxidase n=1 Tax=Madurella mycetomatis TaxID=100816 RepID=A0A175WH28_9PEZI|nr:6-hydroxy-D-nicotine oxidase [Madurella mycetomatis]